MKEKGLNFMSTVIYTVLFIGVGYALNQKGIQIEELEIKQMIILILGSYRLTRVVVYDKVFKLVRDYIKSKQQYVFMQSVISIVTCPWCAGVWVVLFTVIIYYFVPYGQLFVLLMAISGVATFIQLSVNLVGLKAEEKQYQVRRVREENSEFRKFK